MADMITVVALRDGFCVGRRKKGQKFQVPVGTTASWFEPVKKEPEAPEPVKPPEPSDKKTKTLTLPSKGAQPKTGADALI